MLTKYCKICGQNLPITEFKISKSVKFQYYLNICKSCYRKRDREYKKSLYQKSVERDKIAKRVKNYYSKNKEKISLKQKDISKKYYEQNKSQIIQKTKDYYINNKEYYQKYQKEYAKTHPRSSRKRSKKTTIQKIRSSISRSISKRILKFGKTKSESIIKYLDFSFDQLKKHFEDQFEPWMNWNNYGIYNPKTWQDDDISTWRWQVDHIVPHAEFKYNSMSDEQFKECWSLKNLRPYSAKQNILDGLSRIRHKEK